VSANLAIAGIVGDVKSRFEVAESRIFVAGFSSGAALPVITGVTYPEIFAAVGSHSVARWRTATSRLEARSPGTSANLGALKICIISAPRIAP